MMTERGVQFHTYNRKDQRTHAFVIFGLLHEPCMQEVREELMALHNIKVIQLCKMRNT